MSHCESSKQILFCFFFSPSDFLEIRYFRKKNAGRRETLLFTSALVCSDYLYLVCLFRLYAGCAISKTGLFWILLKVGKSEIQAVSVTFGVCRDP